MLTDQGQFVRGRKSNTVDLNKTRPTPTFKATKDNPHHHKHIYIYYYLCSCVIIFRACGFALIGGLAHCASITPRTDAPGYPIMPLHSWWYFVGYPRLIISILRQIRVLVQCSIQIFDGNRWLKSGRNFKIMVFWKRESRSLVPKQKTIT